jgi:hypothetical protein
MRATLGDKHKITSDEKKTLKRLRAEHAITEAEHDQCLGQFGWTPDEYEGSSFALTSLSAKVN